MILKNLSLQNFRNYTRAQFEFSKGTTLIVGPNTSGKTTILEAITCLISGKSFIAQNDSHLINFGQQTARIKGSASKNRSMQEDSIDLEMVLQKDPSSTLPEYVKRKYLVNGVSKRRIDFAGNLVAVLFSPVDIEIIVGSPSHRRNFLDEVLEQVDREYRRALIEYAKALRQRNALLEIVKTTNRRNDKQFEYWDETLIRAGTVITQKREALIENFNNCKKDIFECVLDYDKSVISQQRLLQYKEIEVNASVTLVGPHRDDVFIFMRVEKQKREIKQFGSRGQQRLAVLQLKLLQMAFMEKILGFRPVLLLDDIFSELDETHITHVLSLLGKQQTIITTTHKEFLSPKVIKDSHMIELNT